jgi:hypothetical protein
MTEKNRNKLILLVLLFLSGVVSGYAWSYNQHKVPDEFRTWMIHAPGAKVKLYVPNYRCSIYGDEIAIDAGGYTIGLLAGDRNSIHLQVERGMYSEDITDAKK